MLFRSRRAAALLPGDFYWSRIPVESGDAFALAGWKPLPDGAVSERWVHELLATPPDGELVIYADPRRGVFRYASIVQGKLDACLYLGCPNGNLPERDALALLLDSTIDPEARAGLVAARPLAKGTHAINGPIVCACFAVGLGTIRQAIQDQRASNVSEIGALLRAGTN